MEVVGVTKTGPSFGCELAIKKGFPLYCTFDDKERISLFEKKGYVALAGFPICFRSRMWLWIAPGKLGAENLEKYRSAGVKHIFQGEKNTI